MLSAGDLHGSEDASAAYDAPPECPSAHVFEAEVERRAPGVAKPEARVAVTGSPKAGYDGRLILDGRVRSVHAETCDEAVQALALAVAMAATEEVPQPSDGEDTTGEPTPVANASPPVASLETRDQTAASAPPRATRPQVLVGLGLGATSGVGPGLTPGVAIFGGLDLGGPAIRFGLNGARSGTVATDLGSARFTRVTLHVDGCPVTLHRGAFRVSPCARFDGGVLRGSGESLENAESTALPWLAVSAGARLQLDLTDAVFFEGEARASAPLLRHTFFVRPNDTVYRVPLVTAEAFLSIGHRFSK